MEKKKSCLQVGKDLLIVLTLCMALLFGRETMYALQMETTDVDVETMIQGYDAIKQRIIDIQNKGFDATNKENGVLESLKVALEATARGIKFLPID